MTHQLSPNLALLLVHDLLLAKRGVSAPASHPLRLAVERHKARLNAELTKVRLRRGFSSVEGLRTSVEAGDAWLIKSDGQSGTSGVETEVTRKGSLHPRWVRINTLKTTLSHQMKTTFMCYEEMKSLEQLLGGSTDATAKSIYVDQNIPNLVALSSTADLSKSAAYINGLVILQDKASCFPAYLLDPDPKDGDIIDACAAPGNKTTHLAAIVREKTSTNTDLRVHACERDPTRAVTLERMVRTAEADELVTVKIGQDFLRVDPNKRPWKNVGSLLLDPSCSGSGIVGRDEALRVLLPSKQRTDVLKAKSKKRKRSPVLIDQPHSLSQEHGEEILMSEDNLTDKLAARLSALSTFQLKLLLHAFQFPKARKVAYSTCSIYAEENEQVIMKALQSPIAMERGWHILRRDAQLSGLRDWKIRGNAQVCKDATIDKASNEVAEACIRCEKDTKEGTQGFFVAAFVRDIGSGADEQLLEEEWEGFSNDNSD